LNYYLSDLGVDRAVKICIIAYSEEANSSVRFVNVNTYGEVVYNDNNASVYIHYAQTIEDASSKIIFENCTNYCQITNQDACTGVFVGRANKGNIITNLSFENCVNEGAIYAQTKSVSILLSNNTSTYKYKIAAKNCSNKGMIYVTVKTEGIYNLIANTTNSSIEITAGDGYNTNTELTRVVTYGKKYTVSDNKIQLNAGSDEVRFDIVYSYYSANSKGGKMSISFRGLTIEQVKTFAVYEFIMRGDTFTATSATTYSATGFDAATLCDGKVLVSTDKDNLPSGQFGMTILSYDSEGNLVNVTCYNKVVTGVANEI